MADQKQHAKITPELKHLWTCICLESNPAAALQNFADALRDARLDEAKREVECADINGHMKNIGCNCGRIAALERGEA